MTIVCLIVVSTILSRAHAKSDVHGSISLTSCCEHDKTIPLRWFLYRGGVCHPTVRDHKWGSQFVLLLLLAGDIEVNPGPLNFGFTNCRSMRNKGAAIADLVTSANAEIFALTETHIRSDDTPSFIDDITPVEYKLHHKTRTGRMGGGVGFLVRKEYECSIVNTPNFGSFEHIVVNVRWHNQNIHFVSLYRPPNSSIADFFEEFMTFSGCIAAISSQTIISGDFNIHFDTTSINSTRFQAILHSCNLTQHINFPTHIHGHTLDFLITFSDFSGLRHIKNIGCISDHFAIACQFDLASPPKYSAKQITFRQFHKINMTQIKHDIGSTTFVNAPSTNASDLHKQYIEDMSNVLEKHAPLKTKPLRKPAPVWVTQKYREAKRLRRQFERAWRRDKSLLNRSKLRRQISKCNTIINKSKSDFYTNTIAENSDNPKQLWKELNNILHIKSEAVLPQCSDDKTLADSFSSFFTDKILKIRASFTNQTTYSLSPDRPPPKLNTFVPATTDEVLEIILSSPTKSCMLDPMPTFLVKQFADILAPSLTKLVNYTMSEGIVPDTFKRAVITPLIKKSSLPKNSFTSYRPVSGLCFVSKLVERIVAIRLNQHLTEYKLGNVFQSAYKSGHSTETALLNIKNDVHIALSKGMPTALVLLDLSAAFDTIDHGILLDRLSSWFGFSSTVLNWFSSYLSNRFQSVKVGNITSDQLPLSHGVPQGSVLGPILFSLYTTPLAKLISAHKIINYHFYADDTQLYIQLTPQNFKSVFPILQNCLRDLQSWMYANKLKLNPDKTEFILIGSEAQRRKLASCFPVDVLGSQVQPSDKVRNLGVVFDSDFSLSSHVASVCRSCFVGIRDFRRIRRHLTHNTAIMVANALVSSRLDYCNSLFRSLTCRDLKRLQCIQNTLARVVSRSSKYCHVTPILKDLHWLPIKYRIQFKIATIIYKVLQNGSPHYLTSHVNRYSRAVNTRRNNPDKVYLDVPIYKPSIIKSKVHFQHSFAYDGPTLWNSLPHEVRSSSTLSIFRRRLKTYLFSVAFPP